MRHQTVRLVTIAITTFIPWLMTLAAMGASTSLPRPLFILFHYVLVVLLFGVAFSFYFRDRKGADPFTVTTLAMLCLFAYEMIYVGFLYEGPPWFLNYVDWFVPLFLISSTIYWVGRMMK